MFHTYYSIYIEFFVHTQSIQIESTIYYLSSHTPKTIIQYIFFPKRMALYYFLKERLSFSKRNIFRFFFAFFFFSLLLPFLYCFSSIFFFPSRCTYFFPLFSSLCLFLLLLLFTLSSSHFYLVLLFYTCIVILYFSHFIKTVGSVFVRCMYRTHSKSLRE